MSIGQGPQTSNRVPPQFPPWWPSWRLCQWHSPALAKNVSDDAKKPMSKTVIRFKSYL